MIIIYYDIINNITTTQIISFDLKIVFVEILNFYEYYIIFNFIISNNILINFKIILSICTLWLYFYCSTVFTERCYNDFELYKLT